MEKEQLQSHELNELLSQPSDYTENIPGETQGAIPVYVGTPINKSHVNEQRSTWQNPVEHLLAKFSYVFGYTPLARFPYIMYRHGGVSYLFVYIIMLGLVGFPLFLLESYMGQFSSRGVLGCWEMFPLLKGVGLVILLMTMGVCTYFSIMNAWAMNYFFYSWTKTLPWSNCANHWNTPRCDDGSVENDENNLNNNYTYYSIDDIGIPRKSMPSQEFFMNYVLNISNGIENLGSLQWKIVLALLGTWIIICIVLAFGPKVYGKVAFVTATLPLKLLFIIMIRSVTLPGSTTGLKYLFYPDWSSLANKHIWFLAVGDVLVNLGIGYGPILTLSSYSRFRNDCVKDTFLLPIIQLLYMILASITVMGIVGYLAHNRDVAVSELLTSGPMLIFSLMPSAFSSLPLGSFWSALYYLFFITASLGSLFAYVETLLTAILDLRISLCRLRPFITIGLCIALFLMSLPYSTQGGYYLFIWVDNLYILQPAIILLELFGVVGCYSIFSHVFTSASWLRYKDDLNLMLGGKGCHIIPWVICWPIWSILWIFVTPALVAFYFLSNVSIHYQYIFDAHHLSWDYKFPEWIVGIGVLLPFLLTVGFLVFTPFVLVIVQCCCRKSTFSDSLEYLIKPSRYWGPALPKYRQRMSKYIPENKFNVDPWIEA